MLRFLLISIHFFFCSLIFGQTTFKTSLIKAEDHNVFLEKENGDIFVSGTFLESDVSKVRLARLDQEGNVLWDTIYSHTPSHEFYPKLLDTSDDGIILACESFSYLSSPESIKDILVWKISSNGKIESQTILEAISFQDAQRINDQEYVFLGLSFNETGETMIMYKTDEHGTQIWKTIFGRTYGEWPANYYDLPWSLQIIEGAIFVNSWVLNTPYIHGRLFKINQIGNLEWIIEKNSFTPGLDMTINSVFKLDQNYYFNTIQKPGLYNFDIGTGEYYQVADSLAIYSNRTGGNFDVSCTYLTRLDNIDGNYYLKQFDHIFSWQYEKVLPISGINGKIKTTYDEGYLISTEDEDSLRIIKTDCRGNIDFWSDECKSKFDDNIEIFLYPNPTINTLNIESSFDFDTIEVIDLNGQKVIYKSVCPCNNQEIDVTQLASGVYIIRVLGNDKSVVSKFIKVSS